MTEERVLDNERVTHQTNYRIQNTLGRELTHDAKILPEKDYIELQT